MKSLENVVNSRGTKSWFPQQGTYDIMNITLIRENDDKES